jgi:hypothetical protein
LETEGSRRPISGDHPKKKTPPSGTGLPVNPPDTGIDPSDIPVPSAPDVPSVPAPAPAPAPVPAPAPPGEGAPIDPVEEVEDVIDDVGLPEE